MELDACYLKRRLPFYSLPIYDLIHLELSLRLNLIDELEVDICSPLSQRKELIVELHHLREEKGVSVWPACFFHYNNILKISIVISTL
jgi:hypothetical protein